MEIDAAHHPRPPDRQVLGPQFAVAQCSKIALLKIADPPLDRGKERFVGSLIVVPLHGHPHQARQTANEPRRIERLGPPQFRGHSAAKRQIDDRCRKPSSAEHLRYRAFIHVDTAIEAPRPGDVVALAPADVAHGKPRVRARHHARE